MGPNDYMVIGLARIDDRLIHGQVATRWTKETNVIILATSTTWAVTPGGATWVNRVLRTVSAATSSLNRRQRRSRRGYRAQNPVDPGCAAGRHRPRGGRRQMLTLVIFTPPSTTRSTSVGLVNSSMTRCPAYIGLFIVVSDEVAADTVRKTLLTQVAPPGVTAHVVDVGCRRGSFWRRPPRGR
jgi:hypothetical protein